MSYTYEFLKLQNGSDIRGVAVAGVPSEEVTLTPAAVEKIGAAFVRFFAVAPLGRKKNRCALLSDMIPVYRQMFWKKP